MFFRLFVIGFSAVFLAGCQTSFYSANHVDPDTPAHMIHHSDDHKGQGQFARSRDTNGRKTIVFSPKKGAWAAYDVRGKLVKTGRASGGANWCHDMGGPCRTVEGNYTIYRKQGADCKSSKFPKPNGGAAMPHCMHFHKGYAIHGSYDVPAHNASHGCVRVLPSAAKWLNEDFASIGTKMVIQEY